MSDVDKDVDEKYEDCDPIEGCNVLDDQGAVGRHFFVHNCLAAFFRSTLDFFGDCFYPRIKYKVIGTYDKAVEFFDKCKHHDGMGIDVQPYPSLTLDPSYDFQPALGPGKMFMWETSSLSPGMGKKNFIPYEGLIDDNGGKVYLTPVFTRYEGTMELTFWVNSVYELFDLRVHLFQYTSGYNRMIRPEFIDSILVLPECITTYNFVDGEDNIINVNWQHTEKETKIVDSLGKIRETFPIRLSPMYSIESINDNSRKYGGDDISEYKLSVTLKYEIPLPTYITTTPNVGNIKVETAFGVEPISSHYPSLVNPPNEKWESEKDSAEQQISQFAKYDFDERILYNFTEEDVVAYDPETNPTMEFDNPFSYKLTKEELLIISYDGVVEHGKSWNYNEDGSKILITIEPKLNESLEFYKYKSVNIDIE